jgi:thymidylate synthase (FAD)
MKLIKPSFEIIEQKPRDTVIPADMEIGPRMWKDELINSVYRQIEIAGRTCYKSEDKITETSAKEFVDRMVKSGHGAMLEHGTVYLKVPNSVVDEGFQFGTNWSTLCLNPYTRYISDGDYYYYTTNYRVIIEHDLQGVLEYLCEPTEYHEKRITVKFVCDRGVSHEFVRHRVFSFAQESTRYCNYSKAKFGKELNCIIPCWYKNMFEGNSYNIELCHTYDLTISEGLSRTEAAWIQAMCEAESTYFGLLTEDEPAQQARNVLPLALKTELIMTGTVEQWKGFFKLRDAGSAHPQAYELAHPLHEEFIKRGWIK